MEVWRRVCGLISTLAAISCRQSRCLLCESALPDLGAMEFVSPSQSGPFLSWPGKPFWILYKRSTTVWFFWASPSWSSTPSRVKVRSDTLQSLRRCESLSWKCQRFSIHLWHTWRWFPAVKPVWLRPWLWCRPQIVDAQHLVELLLVSVLRRALRCLTRIGFLLLSSEKGKSVLDPSLY